MERAFDRAIDIEGQITVRSVMQGGEEKGKKCLKLSLLPCFDLLLCLQLAQLNRKPESKRFQVMQSVEISLLGQRRAGHGSGWGQEESWCVPLLLVSDFFFL